MTAGLYVFVQRNAAGSAVSARTNASKKPTLFALSDRQHDMKVVTESELTELLASRQPFGTVAVPPELAERVLGWDLHTDTGDATP